jgi:hypothetical protein
LVAEESAAPLAVDKKVVTLSQTDPDSHILAAKQASVANKFWPRYEIIPPDIQPGAFFDDDILQWDSGKPWTATFINCKNTAFCLSDDQAIRGKKNAKIEMETAGPDSRIIITPPEPILLSKSFDTVEFWVYGKYHDDTTISITFQRKDGSFYKWSGGDDPHHGVGQLFNSWGFGHAVLPETMEKGAKLISIELLPKKPISGFFDSDYNIVLNRSFCLHSMST